MRVQVNTYYNSIINRQTLFVNAICEWNGFGRSIKNFHVLTQHYKATDNAINPTHQCYAVYKPPSIINVVLDQHGSSIEMIVDKNPHSLFQSWLLTLH